MEAIMIGEDIKITVVEIQGTVKLGIEAPREPIPREEIYRGFEETGRRCQTHGIADIVKQVKEGGK